MTTIRDIARIAGVSIATVSLALRDDPRIANATAKRIKDIARDEHYVVDLTARSLHNKRNGIIGMTVFDIDKPYPAKVASEVVAAAKRRNLETLMHQLVPDATPTDKYLATWKAVSQLCDGIILNSDSALRNGLYRLSGDTPMLLLGEPDDEFGLDTVTIAHDRESELAMGHLLDIGCTGIVVLGSPYTSEEQAIGRKTLLDKRAYGFYQACRHHQVDPDMIRFVTCDWSMTEAHRQMLYLLDSGERFDGLLCLTDTMAMGALRALKDRNVQVPEDIAVMGLDGIREGEFLVPSLSTVEPNLREQAEQALTLLTERIEGGTDLPPRHVDIGYRLIQRESTMRLRS
ncbi:LacI family DNA-binding transcriptional regulator [Bifidobacterium sp. 82T10]|uniref:LacI family DNA-binding transcriptional regulator n=1 Tax=Bifidobacterium miconis TaxID=2834435 RepID=A0ABS6WCS6_9BIFI|nr:LacI family DNA-binding transcriptional regulator [Bifidobacterium miconis]MBW3091838.1 LacI family DNA-binding transcriptional regulator [Bifidobacterium miconis]